MTFLDRKELHFTSYPIWRKANLLCSVSSWQRAKCLFFIITHKKANDAAHIALYGWFDKGFFLSTISIFQLSLEVIVHDYMSVCSMCLSVNRIHSDRWCGWVIHYKDTESLPQQCTVWVHSARPWWAPEPGPVKPGGRVMESPHHGAVDPGFHPRTATEAAHSGAYGHCNTIQM